MPTKRQSAARIPIPFEQFVEGLVKTDPARLRAEIAKEKAAKKRAKAKKKV
ncbi:MAG TPA: hypothetical protein VKH44_07890 [Pirellulaceae bacterium]|nr:hypothetical protein [Pirellulaceae bacterium]